MIEGQIETVAMLINTLASQEESHGEICEFVPFPLSVLIIFDELPQGYHHLFKLGEDIS